MIKSILIFLFIFSTSSYAQVESKPVIYLNENLEQIDQLTFINKTLKKIYGEEIINRDSVTIKKLRKFYEFDSLNTTQLTQVQSLFKKYLNIKNFDKNIILVYRDSLLGYQNFVSSIPQKKAHDAMDIDTEKKYIKRREDYDSNQKKCSKFSKKHNVTTIYGYSQELNFSFTPKHYSNIKIPSTIKSVFFQNTKRGTLILKPNGQYFFYTYLTNKQIVRMLNSDWSTYIKEYKLVKNNDNMFVLPFIEEMKKEHESDMRKLAMRQIKQRNKGQSLKKDYSSRTRIRLSTPYNCFGHASY